MLLMLACIALPQRLALGEPPSSRPQVTVHGTVLDYRGQVVEKALVSFSGQSTSIETDRQGRFTAQAPPRAFVSASKHDMLGHVVLSDAPLQTVTIRMSQGPM